MNTRSLYRKAQLWKKMTSGVLFVDKRRTMMMSIILGSCHKVRDRTDDILKFVNASSLSRRWLISGPHLRGEGKVRLCENRHLIINKRDSACSTNVLPKPTENPVCAYESSFKQFGSSSVVRYIECFKILTMTQFI